MRTRKVIRLALAALTALALVAAGCGDDEEEGATGASGDGATATEEVRELTGTIPFPSAIVFYPLYVAQEKGYFAEEGLSVTVEPVDGSGAVIQQVLAGRADFGLGTPSDTMAAANEGADISSVYTMYQSGVFSVVAEEGSGITSLEQLKGKTVGIGSKEGGETDFVKSLLAAEHGFEENRDYELLAVGDGGQATVALDKDQVAAYAASFPDVAIMRLRGLDLVNIVPPDAQSFFDSTVVMKNELIEQSPEVVEGLGRALAKATVWGFENPEGVIDITAKAFPEEAGDREFALALLEETQSLFRLPPSADGKYGYADPEAVAAVEDFLVETGTLEQPVEGELFTNRFVDEYNAFDPATLK